MTPRATENSASIARHIMIQLAGNNLFQNHLFSRDIIKIANSKNRRVPKLLSFIGYVIDLRMTFAFRWKLLELELKVFFSLRKLLRFLNLLRLPDCFSRGSPIILAERTRNKTSLKRVQKITFLGCDR